MTKTEVLEAIYIIRQALVLANKLHPCQEFEEPLVLATMLLFQLKDVGYFQENYEP